MANGIVPFSFELAQELYGSAEQFPVDFDVAWVWLEYSTKGNAKRNFEKAGFIEGVDFQVFITNDKNPLGGRPEEKIKLTCECLKQWGMMSGTPRGKQVRMYFLECERIAKDFLKTRKNLPPMSYETMLEMQKLLFEIADKTNDKRALITLQSSLQNALMPTQFDQETKEELLSVTEVCERHGIRIPKGKDSVIGRKVAALWRSLNNDKNPQTCSKHVGTGHHSAEVKIYPQEFFDRIIAIAQEYL